MQDKADVRVLPPLVLLTGLGLGIVASVVFPAKLLPGRVALVLGLASLAASIFLVLAAARELRRARTAIDVRRPTSALVSTGPFAFSRNPIYLAMMLLHFAVALLLDSVWMMLGAVLLGGVLSVAAIKPEEPYLERKFGDSYRAYHDRFVAGSNA
jgi:protein-S-isoprenylcysteine O-methyltransferase Ste14